MGVLAVSKNLEVSVLLDFYGAMLTDKQRDLIDLYYNEDLSLGEISQLQKITRQGVRDSIKRGELYLYELEEKLGMMKRYRQLQEVFEQISMLAGEAFEVSSRSHYARELTEEIEKIREIALEQLDI